jgi:hypothetical protein
MELQYKVYFQELDKDDVEWRMKEYIIDDIGFLIQGPCILESWRLATMAYSHHRHNGPAFTVTDSRSGQVILEEWFQYDARHRVGGPSRTMHSGEYTEQRWYENDELHRLDGPAILQNYVPTGTVLREEWYKAGVRHREDGPDLIWTDRETGIRLHEEWHLNGVPHRTDGPQSVARHDQTGIAVEEHWFVHGKPHRLDGPPFLVRDAVTGETEVDQNYPGPTSHGVVLSGKPPQP